MILVADAYLGHREEDPEAAARLDEGEHLTVTLSETDRRRSRVRTTAEDGTDLGIVVGRELRDGDVLDADGTPVLVSLDRISALVVDLTGADDDAVVPALELGHFAGNRHWDLAVEGERAYLPVTDSRERMADAVGPHLPDGAAIEFEDVPPTLFDDGGAGHGEHRYGHDGHSHSHGDDAHAHSHDAAVHDVDLGGEES